MRTLADARNIPAPWWRKFRRAWPHASHGERRYLIVFAVLTLLSGALCPLKSDAILLVLGSLPMFVSVARSVANEGMEAILLKRLTRTAARARRLPICETHGFPGEGECDP